MTARECLPNRRGCVTFGFAHAGFAYTGTLGLYPDGRVGEIFVDGPKRGTDLQILAAEAAIAISFGLQHGASLDLIRRAFPRDERGRPQGLLGALADAIAEAT